MVDIEAPGQDRRRAPALSQLLIGVLINAAGLLFTLDNMGVAHAADYLRPAGLIAIGLVKLWEIRAKRYGGFAGSDYPHRSLALLQSLVDIVSALATLADAAGVRRGISAWRGLTGHRRCRPATIVRRLGDES